MCSVCSSEFDSTGEGATPWYAFSFLDDQILDFLSASDTVSEKACLLELKEVPEPYLFQLGSNNLATI